MSFTAASKHVKVLEKARLVLRRVESRAPVCRKGAAPFATAQEWLHFYQRYSSAGLELLDGHLRAEDAAGASRPKRGLGKR
jgi:hypothetical protein